MFDVIKKVSFIFLFYFKSIFTTFSSFIIAFIVFTLLVCAFRFFYLFRRF